MERRANLRMCKKGDGDLIAPLLSICREFEFFEKT
jgi:hypothetical protein